MTKSTKITVCLLTYNHAHYILDTVESILSQKFTDFNLLISDDCSNDGTWNIVQDLSRKYTRIHAIQTPQNSRVAGNANFAVSHARGDYIALLHHDDLYKNTLLSKWYHLAERSSDIAFVFNDYASVDAPDNGNHHSEDLGFNDMMDGDTFLRRVLFRSWGCPVRGTALIRRSCWEEVGGMDEDFGLLADVDLWMRLSARWNVGYVDEPLIIVRQDRPDDYPSEYKGGHFTWKRLRLLYQIHIANRRRYYDRDTFSDWLRRWTGRLRANVDTVKWLLYAIVKRRPDIIRNSNEGDCGYEFALTRGFRKGLKMLLRG